MKRSPFLVILLLLLLPTAARSATCAVSHVFATGETLTAAILNMNPTAEVNCANNIDNQNIGAAGLYATQIVPVTAAQAVFGGSVQYRMPSGLLVTASSGLVQGQLVLSDASGAKPLKGLRVTGLTGNLEITNSNNTAVIMTLTDAGNLSAPTISTRGGTVGPVYGLAGDPREATLHSVLWSCTFASSTSCTSTFSGASAFTSAATYACMVDDPAGGAPWIVQIANLSGTQMQMFVPTAQSVAYPFVCTGT